MVLKLGILIFVFIQLLKGDTEDLTIDIERPKGSGKIVKISLEEFVNNGLDEMSNIYNSIQIKSKGVMVLGLTGTGKSTLVNYLNDIPLECKKTIKWIIDLKFPNVTLPGGFRIGHTDKSETQYPAVYTPQDKDFTYIDNPGFKDNRGTGVEIANAFFRQKLTKQIDQLKFLILITHQDLNLRGEQFRDTIRAFADFLGIFDQPDTKNLSKSMALIITRVEQDDETDQKMIEIFKSQLTQILDNAKQANYFQNINEEKVFRDLIEYNQIGISSNPRRPVTLDNKQSQQIHSLLNRLEYVKTQDVKVRVRIQPGSIPKILVYTQKLFKSFLVNFELRMKKYLKDFYEDHTTHSLNFKEITRVLKTLNRVVSIGSINLDYEKFISGLKEQLELINERELLGKKNLIDFLVQILPEENRNFSNFNREWINGALLKQTRLYIENLIGLGQVEFENFLTNLTVDFTKSIEIQFKQDLSNFEENLLIFKEQASHKTELDSILKNKLFNKIDVKSYLEELVEFVKNIDNEDRKSDFELKREWLKPDLNEKIFKLIKFIELSKQFKSVGFENFLDKYLSRLVSDYYLRAISECKFVQDLASIETVLDKLCKTKSFKKLIDDIYSKIMIDSEKENLLYVGKLLIDGDQMESFGRDLIPHIKNIKKEIRLYQEHETMAFDSNVLTFTGYFINMSSIMTSINRLRLENLKSVRIFATHSFVFDHDFSVNRLKYFENSPDLFIISPFVFFSKPVIIDTTCLSVPEYPNGLPKAQNGVKIGENGSDGKPGLPGFNGGNFHILSASIMNIEYLNFVSIGGRGGHGQDGGNGAEGSTGLSSSVSKVTFENDKIIKVRKLNHKINVSYYGSEGESGTQGGSAGKGGIGGLGGYGGQAFLDWKISNLVLQGERGKEGEHGKAGLPGLGGFYGNIGVRGRLSIEGRNEEMSSTRYDEIWPSKKRGPSGIVPETLNDMSRVSPLETKIDDNYKAGYLNFLREIDSQFRNSDIFDRNFIKNFE